MKIVFSGGGTLGPVTPLLALMETLQAAEPGAHEFLWITTERGVEIPLLKKYGVAVLSIPSGKFRRYFSWKNFSDLRQFFKGVAVARAALQDFKPDVCVTAGGFVSVPVHFAARMLKIPTLVHQQDIKIGLANRLMSWFASAITVSVPQQLEQFKKGRAVYTGNPVRPSIRQGSREAGVEMFRLDESRATVFIFGGGTGAEAINRAVEGMVSAGCELFQIIHVTGMHRGRPSANETPFYHAYPFLTAEMSHAYAAADVVVARAGFNTITEIAACGKPAILIPIGRSHQTLNATWAEAAGAARILPEDHLSPDSLLEAIRDLLTDHEGYAALAAGAEGLFPADAAERILAQLRKISQKAA